MAHGRKALVTGMTYLRSGCNVPHYYVSSSLADLSTFTRHAVGMEYLYFTHAYKYNMTPLLSRPYPKHPKTDLPSVVKTVCRFTPWLRLRTASQKIIHRMRPKHIIQMPILVLNGTHLVGDDQNLEALTVFGVLLRMQSERTASGLDVS